MKSHQFSNDLHSWLSLPYLKFNIVSFAGNIRTEITIKIFITKLHIQLYQPRTYYPFPCNSRCHYL